MYKTPLQQLIVKIDWMIENSDPVHCAGLELAKSLAMSLLPVERDAIVESHKAGDPFNNIHDAEQYYETRYGSLK